MIHDLELKVPPAAVAFVVAAMMWLAARGVPGAGITVPGRVGLSVGLVLSGVCIAVLGAASFRRARTTVNPARPHTASTLVVCGVYRFTRNPMYLGLLLGLLGWVVFLSNLASLALTPVFVLYLNRFQIGPEEKALATLFGQAFDGYKASVRRWL